MRLCSILLFSLLLVGCSTRRTVTVQNTTRKPLSIRLEERHPHYADHVGQAVEISPGKMRQVWYDAEMESTLVLIAGGKEVTRQLLASSGQNPIVHKR